VPRPRSPLGRVRLCCQSPASNSMPC